MRVAAILTLRSFWVKVIFRDAIKQQFKSEY